MAIFGLGYDASIGEKYKLTPSFAAGYYVRGNGKDMGFPISLSSGHRIQPCLFKQDQTWVWRIHTCPTLA